MVGPLFTISSINVAHAAIREAYRTLPLDTPVDMVIGSHCDDTNHLHITVSNPPHIDHEVAVDFEAIKACLAREYPSGIKLVIDNLAAELRTAAALSQHP